MSEPHPIFKKLNVKEPYPKALILNAPAVFEETIAAYPGQVHREPRDGPYGFVQVFGTTNAELQELARIGAAAVEPQGLLWLCYPKKSSKAYKGSDCSRDTAAGMLADEGYEPVRQIAIDDDWSALRFRKPEEIKRMVRSFAVTEAGKRKVESSKFTK
jgi:hypothetical protein